MRILLDHSKLLGFRLYPELAASAQGTSGLGSKLGAKAGLKLGAKLGVKA
ncbi:hypothetical protein [Acuticoccus sp.]